MTRLVGSGLLLAFLAAPVAAQQPPSTTKKPVAAAKRPPGRGFMAINAGVQAAPSDFTDTFTFLVNAEEGTIEARYPSKVPLLLDGSIGYRFWGRVGVAVGASHTSSSGAVAIKASVPHPFLIDHDRLVEGEAQDVSRTEMAAHLQLFYEMVPKGKWRARFFAGPSYFGVEQELVTGSDSQRNLSVRHGHLPERRHRGRLTAQAWASTSGPMSPGCSPGALVPDCYSDMPAPESISTLRSPETSQRMRAGCRSAPDCASFSKAMAPVAGFRARVLAAVRRIPPGRVATYGDIAAAAGQPARKPGRGQHHARV